MTDPAPITRAERKRHFQAAQAAPATTSPDVRDVKAHAAPKKLKKSVFLPLTDGGDHALRHRRCIIEYDGTAFNGFQAQDRRSTMRTVQEAIEDAITRTTGEIVRVKGCSRTDKGVHARGQVIAFASRCSATDRAFRDALNTRLPDDVVCLSLESLPPLSYTETFDPRANAVGKIYEYVVVSGSLRPVLDRHHVWYMKKPLDVSKMQIAVELLTRPPLAKDFSAFTPPKSQQLNTDTGKGNVCTLAQVELQTEKLRSLDEHEDDTVRIRLRFHGDRFLYKMVRNLVGTLVDVGLGRIAPEQMAALFESKDRTKAGQGAPPHGLTLVQALYKTSE